MFYYILNWREASVCTKILIISRGQLENLRAESLSIDNSFLTSFFFFFFKFQVQVSSFKLIKSSKKLLTANAACK